MEALGLNPILLMAQLISFGLLFVVLKKFLYGNIAKTLEERRQTLRGITEKNDELEKNLVELANEKVNLEKKNKIEISKLILETQKSANGIKKDIIDQAEIKSKKIIADAILQIEQEKVKASLDLKKEASKLAAEMATKILSTPANSNKVIDMSILELKKLTSKTTKNG